MENQNNAKLIKDRQLVENDQWKIVADDEALQDFSIISLTRWLENKDQRLHLSPPCSPHHL